MSQAEAVFRSRNEMKTKRFGICLPGLYNSNEKANNTVEYKKKKVLDGHQHFQVC